jgi:hypothetical protein
MKHLGAAAVFDMEVSMGYPQFAVYVIGSLDHASTEIAALHRELAMTIREHRLRWMADRTYPVPYEELGAFMDVLAAVPDGTDIARLPAVPDNCRPPDGTSETGDTRP